MYRLEFKGGSGRLSYEHTERQRQRQAAAAVAASPMQVYGDATHDTWNGSQTHSQASPYT